MKNSNHLIWFFGGIIIGTATGIAAAGRIEGSKTVHLLQTEAAGVDNMFRAELQKLKKHVRMIAGEFTSKIKENLSHPIADLYKATENFTMGQPQKDNDR